MARRVFKKLVRDRIPDIIRKNGDVPKTRVLKVGEYRTMLRAKLVEEAQEAEAAGSKNELISECADMQEVLMALYATYGIKCEEVARVARKKRRERGGFEKRIFLESTS